MNTVDSWEVMEGLNNTAYEHCCWLGEVMEGIKQIMNT